MIFMKKLKIFLIALAFISVYFLRLAVIDYSSGVSIVGALI